MADTFVTLQVLSSPQNIITQGLQLTPAPELESSKDYPQINENVKYIIKVHIDLAAIHVMLQQSKQLQQVTSPIVPNLKKTEQLSPQNQELEKLKQKYTISEDDSDFSQDDASVKYNINQYPIATSLYNSDHKLKTLRTIWLYINGEYKGYIDFRELNEHTYEGNVYCKTTEKRSGEDQGIRIFFMLYSLVQLQFCLIFNDNTRLDLFADSLLSCNTKNIDNQNVQNIIKQLTSIDNTQILDLMYQHFSLGKKEKSQIKAIDDYIDLLYDIVYCYKTNLHYFQTLSKHALVKGNTVVGFNHVKNMRPHNIRWLVHNLNQLTPVENGLTQIQINNQSYIPLKMQTTQNIKSFDIYENRVVIGFLHTVLLNATKVFTEFKTIVQSLEDDQNKLENTQSIAPEQSGQISEQTEILILKKFNCTNSQNTFTKLQEILKEINFLYLQYIRLFNVKKVELDKIPRKVQTFYELKPYAQVFTEINRWFHFGEFNLEKTRYELNVKTLDALFEYYCVYSLLLMLFQNKFSPISESSYLFKYKKHVQQTTNDIANTYILYRRYKNRIQLVTLYYQPVIYSQHFANNILAFRTKTAVPNVEEVWTPDFILKFTDYIDQPEYTTEEYVILDAKFATKGLIIQDYMSELINKYCTNINILDLEQVSSELYLSSKDKKISNILNDSKFSTDQYLLIKHQLSCENYRKHKNAGFGTDPFYIKKLLAKKQHDETDIELGTLEQSEEQTAVQNEKDVYSESLPLTNVEIAAKQKEDDSNDDSADLTNIEHSTEQKVEARDSESLDLENDEAAPEQKVDVSDALSLDLENNEGATEQKEETGDADSIDLTNNKEFNTQNVANNLDSSNNSEITEQNVTNSESLINDALEKNEDNTSIDDVTISVNSEEQLELTIKNVANDLQEISQENEELEDKELQTPNMTQQQKQEYKQKLLAEFALKLDQELGLTQNPNNTSSLYKGYQLPPIDPDLNIEQYLKQKRFYHYRGVKSPKAMIALQGRITRNSQEMVTKYYNSPLFTKLATPITNVCVIEINTKNEDITTKLWKEISSTIPFLSNS